LLICRKEATSFSFPVTALWLDRVPLAQNLAIFLSATLREAGMVDMPHLTTAAGLRLWEAKMHAAGANIKA
jgi:hypothetical protein